MVLLLDGFDEMAVASSGGAEEQLWILTRPTETPGATASGNRMVVSCRPAGGQLDATTIDLSPFDMEQTARFFTNRLGAERARAALDALPYGATLAMASLLMVLELLVQDDAGVGSGGISLAALLERYVERWSTQDPDPATPPAQRERIVERLAAASWKLSVDQLPAEQLVATLQSTDPQRRTAPRGCARW